MQISSDVRKLWARTRLRVHAAPLRLVSLPVSQVAAAARMIAGERPFASLISEPDEVSLALLETTWNEHREDFPGAREAGPYRALTFNLDVDLAISGFFAPAAERLAEAGISIVPQCAFLKDHLLVREADLERAVSVLEELISECRAGPLG